MLGERGPERTKNNSQHFREEELSTRRRNNKLECLGIVRMQMGLRHITERVKKRALMPSSSVRPMFGLDVAPFEPNNQRQQRATHIRFSEQ